MNYELDLQIKRHDIQERLWETIKQRLMSYLITIPPEQRHIRNDKQIDEWCAKVVEGLDLVYYRRDNWLCFCDKELAPN